jgi:hypothetical protein
MRLSAVLLCLLLTGCSILPSGWNPFGTPATRVERASDRQQVAEQKVLVAVQEEVHKTGYAIDGAVAGNKFALSVAQQHQRSAVSLLNQALGTPPLPTEQKWRELVDRQTSLDDTVRREAEKENSRRQEQLGKLSKDLESKEAALDAANQRAVEYAKELQGFKDFVLKIGWVVGGLFLLYFLGQILQFAANINPAFGTASNFVNAVVSPAMHSAAYRARKAAAAAASALKGSP